MYNNFIKREFVPASIKKYQKMSVQCRFIVTNIKKHISRYFIYELRYLIYLGFYTEFH